MSVQGVDQSMSVAYGVEWGDPLWRDQVWTQETGSEVTPPKRVLHDEAFSACRVEGQKLLRVIHLDSQQKTF